ncbi:MAG: alpha/beta fold hydrolase [Rhodospirillaceae bacterium]|nr:alpha/beta fold hydrolase [Rhodospirillaceae bacterium]
MTTPGDSDRVGPGQPVALFRSTAGRAAVQAAYDRQLARLTFAYDTRFVETRFGPTHVLMMGPADAPPAVAVHGVNFPAPFVAPMAQNLAQRFRLHLPDVVGQPGRSAQVRPSRTGHAYAGWLSDVMDGLNLPRAMLIGLSFGGSIALDLAAVAPQRIEKLALIVPAGIAGADPDLMPLARMFFDWYLFRWFPDRARIAEVVKPLAWTLDDTQYDYFSAILQHARWLISPPGPFAAADLAAFTAPCALHAADADIFFPAARLIPAARAALPTLVEAHAYPSSHVPTPAMQAEVMTRVMRFLGG